VKTTTRVGIIGTGWGRMHIGGFRVAGASVVAICGRDPERTAAIAAREGIELAFTDVNKLCAAVDLVVVASPDGLHHAHVCAALDAGRQVLCEKPLTIAAADARDLVERAAKAATRCAVSFPYRHLPPLLTLSHWLADRSPVRQIDVTVRSGFLRRVGASEGESGDFGGSSHVIDAALWLAASEPIWVQAALDGKPTHSASLQLGLRSGARITLVHRPTIEPGIHGNWALCGEDWEAGFFAGYQPQLGGWRISAPRAFVEGGGWVDVAEGAEPKPGQREPWAEAHVSLARAFLKDGRGLAAFADGARVQAVIDGALRSESSGQRVQLD
jgi:myo-inositol 2-dehydrogenase / D-chiro-inositol 1-dehydrogenase